MVQDQSFHPGGSTDTTGATAVDSQGAASDAVMDASQSDALPAWAANAGRPAQGLEIARLLVEVDTVAIAALQGAGVQQVGNVSNGKAYTLAVGTYQV